MGYTKRTKTLLNMQVYAEKYAEDQEAFFKDYAEAHAKLSNLGAKFDPPEVCLLSQPCVLLGDLVLVDLALLPFSFHVCVHI